MNGNSNRQMERVKSISKISDLVTDDGVVAGTGLAFASKE